MLDYTAIDFETANSFRGSPCSVGLVKVRGGEVVDSYYSLIQPPASVDHFDHWNVRIHGITADMVTDAPTWSEALKAIVDFVGSDTLIAHNAAFDTGVIRHACDADQLPWPSMRFLCTLVMARKALALRSYRLPFVTKELGVDFSNHHDALADATAVVGIITALAARHNVSDLDSLAAAVGVSAGHFAGGSYTGSRPARAATRNASAPSMPVEVNAAADPDGYLYGRVVVFTGALSSMSRDEARQACARLGAKPEDTTTKRTNVLVMGSVNPASLTPGASLSSKAVKAFALQSKGQQIEVMTEDDFLRCLDSLGTPSPSLA